MSDKLHLQRFTLQDTHLVLLHRLVLQQILQLRRPLLGEGCPRGDAARDRGGHLSRSFAGLHSQTAYTPLSPHDPTAGFSLVEDLGHCPPVKCHLCLRLELVLSDPKTNCLPGRVEQRHLLRVN